MERVAQLYAGLLRFVAAFPSAATIAEPITITIIEMDMLFLTIIDLSYL
jgi:hypothetical protein